MVSLKAREVSTADSGRARAARAGSEAGHLVTSAVRSACWIWSSLITLWTWLNSADSTVTGGANVRSTVSVPATLLAAFSVLLRWP